MQYYSVLVAGLLLSTALALNLDIKTDSENVMNKGEVGSVWNPDWQLGSPCHPVPSVLEGAHNSNRTFTFTNNENFDISLVVDAESDDTSVFRPSLNTHRINIPKHSSYELELKYNCEGLGWSNIKLQITSGYGSWTLDYVKICDTSQLQPFDWSMVVLLMLALIIVGASAIASTDNSTNISDDESNELQTHHAFGFVICGSISLIALFLLLDYLIVVLTILIVISGIGAMVFTLSYFCKSVQEGYECEIRYLGPVSVKTVVMFTVAVGIAIYYVITKSWILNNLIGICFVFMFLKTMKLSSIKVAAALLGMAFFYDIFWVFFSSKVFGSNVMVHVATGLDLPIKLQCPHFQPLPVANTCGLLGLGDLVLPGLLIAFAARVDLIEEAKYFYSSMGAYALALILCLISLMVTGLAQPALLYISPCLILSFVYHSHRRGEFHKLWRGYSLAPLSETEVAMRQL